MHFENRETVKFLLIRINELELESRGHERKKAKFWRVATAHIFEKGVKKSVSSEHLSSIIAQKEEHWWGADTTIGMIEYKDYKGSGACGKGLILWERNRMSKLDLHVFSK